LQGIPFTGPCRAESFMRCPLAGQPAAKRSSRELTLERMGRETERVYEEVLEADGDRGRTICRGNSESPSHPGAVKKSRLPARPNRLILFPEKGGTDENLRSLHRMGS